MAPADKVTPRPQRRLPRALLAACLLLVAVRVALPPPPMLVSWVPLEEAQRRAEATGKPLLYDFTAAWCEPCRALEVDVFADPGAAALINDRFVPVRVVDRQMEDGANLPAVEALQGRFGVQAFPTLVVALSNGQILQTHKGFGGGRRGVIRFLRTAFIPARRAAPAPRSPAGR